MYKSLLRFLTIFLGTSLICASTALAQARAYVVTEAGDSLYQIAKVLNPGSVSDAQVMSALFRLNRHAFKNGQLFSLKPNVRLEIPTNRAMQSEPAARARNFVRLQEKAHQGKGSIPGIYSLRAGRTTTNRNKPGPSTKADMAQPKKPRVSIQSVKTNVNTVKAPGVSKSVNNTSKTATNNNVDKASLTQLSGNSTNQLASSEPTTKPLPLANDNSSVNSASKDLPSSSVSNKQADQSSDISLSTLGIVFLLLLAIPLAVALLMFAKHKQGNLISAIKRLFAQPTLPATSPNKHEIKNDVPASTQTELVGTTISKAVGDKPPELPGSRTPRQRRKSRHVPGTMNAMQALVQVEAIIRRAEQNSQTSAAASAMMQNENSAEELQIDSEDIRQRIDNASRELGMAKIDLPPLTDEGKASNNELGDLMASKHDPAANEPINPSEKQKSKTRKAPPADSSRNDAPVELALTANKQDDRPAKPAVTTTNKPMPNVAEAPPTIIPSTIQDEVLDAVVPPGYSKEMPEAAAEEIRFASNAG